MIAKNAVLSAMVALSLSVSAGALPPGFAYLDYVEATGSQPVITEYVPKNITSIRARMALTRTDVSQTIFCARGEVYSDRTFTMFWIANQGLRWDYGLANGYHDGVYDKTGISAGEPFDLDIRGNEVYLDGHKSVLSCSPVSDYQTDNALSLFAAYAVAQGALQETTTFSSLGYVRLYSLTAKEGDDVVLNLIPCLNSDHIAGLYDTVSGSFVASCKSSSPLKQGNLSEGAGSLTIATDRDGVLCRLGVGSFDIPAAVPEVICAEPSVDSSLATITPIGWELSVVPSEGEPYKVKNDGTNACCCTFTAQAGDLLSLKWHCAKTEHKETLPAGYTRLKSVKATGAQALLTDYTPKGKTGMDLVMRVDTTKEQTVFCARGADGSRNSFSLHSLKGALRWDYGASDVNNGKTSWWIGDDSVSVSIRGNDIFIGSKRLKISKSASSDYTAGNRLVLFASYNTDQPQEPTGFANFATMELFLLRVLEDGLLVRQYLPCRRNADNAVGLYDTVTGTFCLPSGDPLVAGEMDDFVDSRAKDGETELPSGYAGVEFVEATGSQYVVTDYTPNGNSEFGAKLDIVEQRNAGIFCARGTDAVNPYTLFYIANGVNFTGIRWDYASIDVAAISPVGIGIWRLQGFRNEFYINGTKSPLISKPEPVDFTAGNRLVLFASYATSSPAEPTGFNNFAKVRLYSFAIAEGGSLKMNLLPCRRMSDEAVGLYDAVGKKFYSSSSGSPLNPGESRETLGVAMTVVGKGGELGNPTFPYGVSRGVEAGDSFVCSVQRKASTVNGTLSCLGYLLETNNLNGAWIPWKSGRENSFVYEHPEGTRVRLTWKWGNPGFTVFVR